MQDLNSTIAASFLGFWTCIRLFRWLLRIVSISVSFGAKLSRFLLQRGGVNPWKTTKLLNKLSRPNFYCIQSTTVCYSFCTNGAESSFLRFTTDQVFEIHNLTCATIFRHVLVNDIFCGPRMLHRIDNFVGHIMAFSQDLELYFNLIGRPSKGTHLFCDD
jgi:hypothetical protein